MTDRVMANKAAKIIAEGIKKGIYRTFKASGRTVIIDDFIYRRLFRDGDVLPRRKYTFIVGFCLSGGCPHIVLKRKTNKYAALPRYIMHAGRGELVDHRNRNPLDNRRCNLRIVNARQNMLNRKMKNNTGLIGVSVYKDRGRFYANTTFKTKEKKKLYFHCPDTPFNRILTALAHDKFVLQEREEVYAPLNFPEWQHEPLRRILMKEDLNLYKETSSRKENSRTGDKKVKLNQKILRFCRRRAKLAPQRHREKRDI